MGPPTAVRKGVAVKTVYIEHTQRRRRPMAIHVRVRRGSTTPLLTQDPPGPYLTPVTRTVEQVADLNAPKE